MAEEYAGRPGDNDATLRARPDESKSRPGDDARQPRRDVPEAWGRR